LKISREFKVGLLVILAGAFLLIGVNFLKGINMFADNREFVAFYENVDGLSPSNPVIFKGSKVGLVKEVKYIQEIDLMRVVIIIDNPDVQIPIQSICTIESADILGAKQIKLSLNKNTNQYAVTGDTLVGDMDKSLEVKVNEQIAPLKAKTEQLIGSIDTIITSINAMLDEDMADNISRSVVGARKSIERFERTLAKFDELMSAQSGKIGRILNNVEETTKGLAANAGKIDRAIDNLDKFSQNLKDVELKTTITKLNAASDEILTMVNKINRGEGNLGKLIHDDSLYESLLETNAAVQMLLEDIRVYPSRYLHFSVFGTKEKGAKLSAREQQYLKEVLDLNKGGVIKMSPEEERKLRDMLGI